MRLRPTIVNEVLHPGAVSRGVFPLLIPEDAVIVAEAGHQVRQTITVHVFGVDEPGISQFELRMKDPITAAQVRRCLKPTLRSDDIGAPVAVDITGADAVSPALWADFMPDPGIRGALGCQFVPSQRKILIAKLRQELQRFADVENVHQESEFYRRLCLHDVLTPWPPRVTWILPPAQWLRPIGTADQVGVPVSMNINRQIAQVLQVGVGIGKLAKLVLDKAGTSTWFRWE